MRTLGTKRFHTDFLSYKLSSFWFVIVIALFLFALDGLDDSLARSRCRIVIDQLWIIYFCQIQLKFFNTFLTPLVHLQQIIQTTKDKSLVLMQLYVRDKPFRRNSLGKRLLK